MLLLQRTADAVPMAYDGFDYPNDSAPLEDKNGGFGWDGPWRLFGRELAGVFTHSQDDTSLSHPMIPFTPEGDRVLAVGPADGGGNNNQIDRDLAETFDMESDGTLYASFLFAKSGSDASSGDNQELDLLGTGGSLRVGSTSGDEFWMGQNFGGGLFSQPADSAITFGDTYFIVLRIQASASADDLFSMSVFDQTESVPSIPPDTWDADYVVANPLTDIASVRFWIGTTATGSHDELRIGPTWQDVVPNENLLLGDFNDSGEIDPGDFQILSENVFLGTTYEEGDINFSGNVDLTDFAIFREIYLSAGFAMGNTVPEPTAVTLLGVGCCLALLAPGRTRRWCR